MQGNDDSKELDPKFWENFFLQTAMDTLLGEIFIDPNHTPEGTFEYITALLPIEDAEQLISNLQTAIQRLERYRDAVLRNPDRVAFLNERLRQPSAQSVLTDAESGPKAEAPGWLYLLKRGHVHKIGISNNPERRLGEIAKQGELAGVPDQPMLIDCAFVQQPFSMEQKILTRFADARIGNSEWLELSKRQAMVITRAMRMWRRGEARG